MYELYIYYNFLFNNIFIMTIKTLYLNNFIII